MSVDALRGFDMLWIIGAGSIVQAIEGMHEGPVTRLLAGQLKHSAWEGLTFYDVIFPLFLFIVGVAMVFSLDKAVERGGRAAALKRVARRAGMLYVLGVFYYGGVSNPWPDVQMAGVLQRIAACYLFAALIYCFLRSVRGLLITAVSLLLLYWGLLAFVPFPNLILEKNTVEKVAAEIGSDSPFAISAAVNDRISGVYEEGYNLTNYLDFLFLPGRRPQRYYINEGLLSTIPAVALPLLGAVAGLLLKNRNVRPRSKTLWLLGGGAAAILVGLLWSLQFPIIKRIWTSSYVLMSAGLSCMLLAVFYWIIDVQQRRWWCQPFVWIGYNAITIYMVSQILDFESLANRLAGGDVRRLLDTHVTQGFGSLTVAALGLLIAICFVRFLFQRKIFLRV